MCQAIFHFKKKMEAVEYEHKADEKRRREQDVLEGPDLKIRRIMEYKKKNKDSSLVFRSKTTRWKLVYVPKLSFENLVCKGNK